MADLGATAPLVPDVPTIARSRASSNDVFDRVWRLLSSVRFAMLLISILATGVLAGTLIMQVPPDVGANPTGYNAWLTQPRDRYGTFWTSVFSSLDLFRVFSSLWFRGLLAILTLSVVVCTVNRMPGITAAVRRPLVNVPERLFDRAPLRAEFAYTGISAEQAQLQAAKVLGARRFRTLPWEDGDSRALFADKNRFGKYGTFLNHIGIVSLLGAAVLGSTFGWRDDGFMVPEGSTRQVGWDTGLSVHSESFVDEYYPTGTAKDFRSDLVLFKQGEEVARKTIRVNDPLDYNGVRFHQAFFGPAAVMRVTDPDGNVVWDDGVALGYQFTASGLTRNGGFFTLGNRNGLPTLAVYVLLPAAQREADPDIPAGSVRLEFFEPRQARPSAIVSLPQGEPQQIMGYTFEFIRERQFSGLQVTYNPAIDVIWAASASMVLGIMAVFYLPLRRVWVRAEPSPRGVRLRIAAIGNRDVLFAREFENLALAIDKQVAGLPGAKPARPGTRPVAPTPREAVPTA